jgi:hypothetical protein
VRLKVNTKSLQVLERLVKGLPQWIEIFENLFTILTSFICFQSEEEPIVITNWIVFTYLAPYFSYAPYLHIYSATPRCGKSKTLEVIEHLVHKPLNTANISDSALFRSLDEEGGTTLILDEIDKLDKQARSEQIAIMNSGYSKYGANVVRTEGSNGNFKVKTYNPFGPKVFSGIGQENLGNTLRDRSFPIELKRMLPHERTERLIKKVQFQMLEDWRNKIVECVEELKNDEEIFNDYEIENVINILADLNSDDRAIDISHPLIAIACLGSDDWAIKSINAVNNLTGKKTEEVSWETEILLVCREIASTDTNNGIHTKELLDKLNFWPDSRFQNFNNGNGINSHQLSKVLKSFGIQSTQLRVNGENKRGYLILQSKEHQCLY